MVESGGLEKCSSSVQPKPGLERKFSGDIELIDNKSPSPMTTPTRPMSDLREQFKDIPIPDSPIRKRSKSPKDEDISLGSNDNLESPEEDPTTPRKRSITPPLLKLAVEECGLPLELFRKGCFCHPYLSLTYLDVLGDSRVRGFTIGASNFLFKQRRDLFDVIVEIEGGKIDILDLELKRQLNLSTEDLRFADYLVKHTLETSSAGLNFLDGTCWQGGDEWLRYQFKVYILHLLRTSECDGEFYDAV